MFKTRVLIVIVIVVASAAIYFLPRYVVHNDDSGENPGETESKSADTVHVHAQALPDSLATRFKTLYDLYSNAENQEKRFIFADSLAKGYKNAGILDSSARYFEVRALENPTTENFILAADGYYEAMNFATDATKRATLAGKAGDYYKRVLKENPNMFDAKSKMAMTLTYGSNPMEGIMMLREVIAADPENETALFNLGILAITSGQYEKAIERFEKLLQISPENTEANFYMGFCLNEMGKSAEAAPYLQKVMKGNRPELASTAKEILSIINN